MSFVWVFAVVVLAVAVAWHNSAQLNETIRLVAHTREVLVALETALRVMDDAETGVRGFLITGQEPYLEPYQDALTRIGGALKRIKELTVDNPNQQRRMSELERLVASHLDYRARVVRTAREQGLEAGRQLVATGAGKQDMDAIRKLIAGLQAEEERLLGQRQEEAAARDRRAQWTLAALATLILAVVLGSYLLIRQHLAMRILAEKERDRFFDLSLDMLCIASKDGYFKRLNPAFSQTLGWSHEEMLARPFLDFVHPDDRSATLREVERQVVAGERVLHFENRYQHKDGSWRWLSWKSVPQPGGFMFATARDVTERKWAELEIRRLNESLEQRVRERTTELRESEERYRSLFERSPAGIVLMDSVTLLPVEFNAVAHRQLGYSREEFAQLQVPDYEAVEKPEETKAHVEKILREGHDEFETRHRTKQGEIRIVLVSAQRIEFGGRPLLHCLFRDITEHKRAEEKIRQLNTELEQRVQERTAQLEAANQELESFSYSVSHDLRAPLRHVQGYVEMLVRATEGQLSDKARRYLNTIADASRDMGALIDDLLAFSRMRRAELQEASVDLDRLMQQCLRSLEMASRGRNIVWKIRPLPKVTGDPSMLKQVFANLLDNSVKYTRPRDPAQIEVGCAGEEDGRLILFVRDNGVGFDMQYVHKLFGVFQRLHRAEEFEGTGIGLANVQRIIHRHGGRIWAEGKLNEGATFYFTLKSTK